MQNKLRISFVANNPYISTTKWISTLIFYIKIICCSVLYHRSDFACRLPGRVYIDFMLTVSEIMYLHRKKILNIRYFFFFNMNLLYVYFAYKNVNYFENFIYLEKKSVNATKSAFGEQLFNIWLQLL